MPVAPEAAQGLHACCTCVTNRAVLHVVHGTEPRPSVPASLPLPRHRLHLCCLCATVPPVHATQAVLPQSPVLSRPVPPHARHARRTITTHKGKEEGKSQHSHAPGSAAVVQGVVKGVVGGVGVVV